MRFKVYIRPADTSAKKLEFYTLEVHLGSGASIPSRELNVGPHAQQHALAT